MMWTVPRPLSNNKESTLGRSRDVSAVFLPPPFMYGSFDRILTLLFLRVSSSMSEG
jgi:hypothetical protein